MANIAVYCGASPPKSEALKYYANDVGSELARLGHTVIYGGSGKGLMGLVANGALSMGGTVIGLIVPALTGKEPPIKGVANYNCETLPNRLKHFRELANAHLILPGGTGTLEELSSAFTAICHHHNGVDVPESMPPCPIYLLDDPEGLNSQLYAFLKRSMEHGFINETLFPHIQLKSMAAVMAALPKANVRQIA